MTEHRPHRMDLIGWGGALTSAVWLFFLVAPIRNLLASAHPPAFKALVLAQAAIFVALYLALLMRNSYSGGQRDAPYRHWHVAVLIAMTALTVSTAALAGSDWIAGFLFTSAAAGSKLPSRWTLAAIGILEAVMLVLSRAIDASLGNTGQAFVFIMAIGLITAGVARLIQTIRALEQTRQELARLAVAEERLRVARDLHDLLGHSLSLIAVKSELARQLVPLDPEQAMGEISDIERVSRSALSDVRAAVSAYRQRSLAEELEASRELLTAANVRVDIDRPAEDIPSPVSSILAWTVREGVTNTVRHGRAGRCAIRVEKLCDTVRCTIENDDRRPDRGPGVVGTPVFGNGLSGLAERVRTAGGRLEAAMPQGGGFRLSVTIPVAPERSAGGDGQP